MTPSTETLMFPTKAEGVIRVVDASELESYTRDGWELIHTYADEVPAWDYENENQRITGTAIGPAPLRDGHRYEREPPPRDDLVWQNQLIVRRRFMIKLTRPKQLAELRKKTEEANARASESGRELQDLRFRVTDAVEKLNRAEVDRDAALADSENRRVLLDRRQEHINEMETLLGKARDAIGDIQWSEIAGP